MLENKQGIDTSFLKRKWKSGCGKDIIRPIAFNPEWQNRFLVEIHTNRGAFQPE
jgi:hypothetical protein